MWSAGAAIARSVRGSKACFLRCCCCCGFPPLARDRPAAGWRLDEGRRGNCSGEKSGLGAKKEESQRGATWARQAGSRGAVTDARASGTFGCVRVCVSRAAAARRLESGAACSCKQRPKPRGPLLHCTLPLPPTPHTRADRIRWTTLTPMEPCARQVHHGAGWPLVHACWQWRCCCSLSAAPESRPSLAR